MLPPVTSDVPRLVYALTTVPPKEQFKVVGHDLLIRGTIDWRQLLTECRIGKVPYGAHGTIHRGFHDVYHSLRPAIMEVVRDKDIRFVAGHSLGGVLACLVAQDLEKYSAPRGVITVGSPRIGDEAWCDLARPYPIYRVTNREDLVPRLPPLCRHLGQPVSVHFDHGSVLSNHDLTEYANFFRAQASCPFGYVAHRQLPPSRHLPGSRSAPTSTDTRRLPQLTQAGTERSRRFGRRRSKTRLHRRRT